MLQYPKLGYGLRATQVSLSTRLPSFDPAPLFSQAPEPFFCSSLGALYSADCMDVLPRLKPDSIDTVFADPPFNLGKVYRPSTNDSLPADEYLAWSKTWLRELVRVVKPGGAIFIYNLPRWNVVYAAYLLELGMEFRHWIAIEMSASMPIAGKLHPSHYGLLYLTKGKPKTFRRIRTPILKCRHCDGEVKDYGGHRSAMNPRGVTLKDVWSDIPPMRHRKFKSEGRNANALSTKLLDRVVEMSTKPGDIVLDPFGGSGTTFSVCERKNRKWIGIEIDYADDIVARLTDDVVEHHKNDDFVEVEDAST